MQSKVVLDANAILRYLLDDIHEQYAAVQQTIENEDCCSILSVIQEAVYILENYYGAAREDIAAAFGTLADIIRIEDEDVCRRAFGYYVEIPKIDYVGCILCAYHSEREVDIFTFDQKLNKKIRSLNMQNGPSAD